jgi:HK97 family phage prohead protease
MQTKLERRFLGTTLRALNPVENSASPGQLVGYSAKYSSPVKQNLSEDLGGFRERLAPGCFYNSLKRGDDVLCLVNHDKNLILGRTKSGSLKLSSDDVGLRMACNLPNTQLGRDIHALVTRGDIQDQSFAFICEDQDFDEDLDPDDRSKRIKVRTVKRAKLMDVSAVCSPAYAQTSLALGTSDVGAWGRSFDSLFPQGLPLEIRSHCPWDVRQRFESIRTTGGNRRRLTDLFVGM